MRKLSYILICFFLIGCGTELKYRKITSDQAYYKMHEDTVILDVRTETEYEIEHIENAINVPVDELEEKIENLNIDKETTILVYCHSGNRSKVASNLLVKLGYFNVYDFGGIIDWEYDTVKQ